MAVGFPLKTAKLPANPLGINGSLGIRASKGKIKKKRLEVNPAVLKSLV
jgi:hypothetical protein